MRISTRASKTITQALRQGVVAGEGLQHLAVGLEPLMSVVDGELRDVAFGGGASKWIRGDYGGGKTFATRLLCARAREMNFATAEVQISVNDTPLHRLESVYRRLVARLTTVAHAQSALKAIVDGWLDLSDRGDNTHQAIYASQPNPSQRRRLPPLLEARLGAINAQAPSFAMGLRHYCWARRDGDPAFGQALMGWLAGQPHVGHRAMAKAGIKGSMDGAAALSFLRGLLIMLRQSGHAGLVVVLDEAETLQRQPAHLREKSLNALRQLMDMLADNQLPGLYLVVTGTPQFFDGYKGLKGLSPLSQRVETRFTANPAMDNLRGTQVRLPVFNAERLIELGIRARALFVTKHPKHLERRVDDAFVRALAASMTERFGGQLPVVPRVFLKTLVDICDRCDSNPAFDPRRDYELTLDESALKPTELSAVRARRLAEVTAVNKRIAGPRRKASL